MAIQRPGQGFQRPGVPFGPPGSPVTGGPVANRYTRTRTRPVNPPGIVRPPGIAPGLPVTPPMPMPPIPKFPGLVPLPNPGMPGGKIDIGGPIAGGPARQPIDSGFIARDIKFPGQPGGPSQQPTNPGITNPNVSIGTPVQQPSYVRQGPQQNADVSKMRMSLIGGGPMSTAFSGVEYTDDFGHVYDQSGKYIRSQDTYTDAQGQFRNAQGNMFTPDFSQIGGKSAPAQPGGTTPTLPQLEAMPYTGNPTYQSTQATQQNPNASIGFGGGIGSVFGAPFSGIGSAFTQASQQPDMSEKDTQALQGFGQAFSNLGSSFASTMGSAMPLLGGKSQPAQPGMGQANQTGPMSGGFNPSLGNTTLPGNF